MPKAFLFDVYGTVCDWFTPMRDALAAFGPDGEHNFDQLARDWRNGYGRATGARVRDDLPFIPLADMTKEVLRDLLATHSIAATDAELAALNGVWRRLPAWPDVAEGLDRLRAIGPVAPCSNGNFVDMEALADFAGLQWTTLAGSEVSQQYKPSPATYLMSAAKVGVAPGEAMMVASHQGDLKAAQAQGLMTAFVMRPNEFGGKGMGEELEVTGEWDVVASSFIDLADQLADQLA